MASEKDTSEAQVSYSTSSLGFDGDASLKDTLTPEQIREIELYKIENIDVEASEGGAESKKVEEPSPLDSVDPFELGVTVADIDDTQAGLSAEKDTKAEKRGKKALGKQAVQTIDPTKIVVTDAADDPEAAQLTAPKPSLLKLRTKAPQEKQKEDEPVLSIKKVDGDTKVTPIPPAADAAPKLFKRNFNAAPDLRKRRDLDFHIPDRDSRVPDRRVAPRKSPDTHADSIHTPQSTATHPDRRNQPVPHKQSRKEFVAQQEEAWGANDTHDATSIPEGELTYEQYLAQRPVAKEGDIIHATAKNGATYSYEATTGKRVKTEEYRNRDVRSETAQYDFAKVAAHEEALQIHETVLRERAERVKRRLEGERIVESNPRLQGLLALGQEIRTLYETKIVKKTGEATPEAYEEHIAPELRAKKQLYDYVLSKLKDEATDERALEFIHDTTVHVVDEYNFNEVKGSAFIGEHKVTILKTLESPDHDQKAYEIELDDGTKKIVYASEVEFKQELEIPAEKKSRFERLKDFFKSENALRKRSGMSYGYGVLERSKAWLRERHVDEYHMSFDQINEQRRKNRVHNMLGVAAGVGAALVAARFGVDIFDNMTSVDTVAALGVNGEGLGGVAEAANNITPEVPGVDASLAGLFPDIRPEQATGEVNAEVFGTGGLSLPDWDGETGTGDGSQGEGEIIDVGDAGWGPNDLNMEGLQNPAYNIPSGGEGLQLFENLGLSNETWNANAQTLYKLFPNEFYVENGDVRFAHPGWLSTEARQFIETLRQNR